MKFGLCKSMGNLGITPNSYLDDGTKASVYQFHQARHQMTFLVSSASLFSLSILLTDLQVPPVCPLLEANTSNAL